MVPHLTPVRLCLLACLLPVLLPVLGAGAGCAGVKSDGASGGGGGQSGSGKGGSSGGGQGGASTGGGGTTTGPRDATVPPGDVEGNCTRDLHAVVRDFRSGEKDGRPKHPDFEFMVSPEKGIVESLLGLDAKPVYAGGPTGTVTTTGKDNFDQWFRDVDGINIRIEITIPLAQDAARPGLYVYDSDLFYPIDDQGWGNQYLAHNQDFTMEMHFTFPYRGGEVFTFRGDDDLFLFVNRRLAIDLGGVHTAQRDSVDLDARAAELGLVQGNTYQMDLFYADRHCCQSTFHLETSLQCIGNVIVE